MGELSNGSREKTYSILDTDLTVSGTTAVDSGLYVTVAANSAYRLESVLNTTGSADGILSRLVLGATPVSSGLYYEVYDTGAGTYSMDSTAINTTVTTGSDFIRRTGVFVSPYTGVLKIIVRESVDFGGDSVIKAGSYLLIQPL